MQSQHMVSIQLERAGDCKSQKRTSTRDALLEVENSLLHFKGEGHVQVAVFDRTGCSCSTEAGREPGEVFPVELVLPE